MTMLLILRTICFACAYVNCTSIVVCIDHDVEQYQLLTSNRMVAVWKTMIADIVTF